MINFKEEIVNILNEEIEALDRDQIEELLETPPDYRMGDFAFPVFSLAKTYRKNPALIAAEIAQNIQSPYFEKVENASAYVNFFLNKELLAKEILYHSKEKKENFGQVNVGENRNVIVEYSSTNIAKPFHIGHIRSTVIGDSIKRIYKFLGYHTIAINHIGDYGTQFGMLICAYKKWGNREEIEKDPIPQLLQLYVRINREAENDPQLKDECRNWFRQLENQNDEAVQIWQWFRDVSLQEFDRVYQMLGIEYDSYNGESFYSDKMPAIIDDMRKNQILIKSEGAEIIDLEKYGLPPAIVVKSDGTTIYLTRDIAAAKYRHDTYEPYKNIYVVGSQQNLHFRQLKAVIQEMGYEWYDEIVHVPFGMVSLEDGTLSTRQGKVVYLEDVLNTSINKVKDILDTREQERGTVIEEKEQLSKVVGIGAIKFQELFNQRIKDYVFDWDKLISFEGETGPYVQYVHARICSLLKKGSFEIDGEVHPAFLNSEEEINIIRLLYNFTNTVIDAHEKYEPYFITRYIVDLAKTFNKYYNQTQIITGDPVLTNTRLMLCYTVKNVIAKGLELLGIEAPEKM